MAGACSARAVTSSTCPRLAGSDPVAVMAQARHHGRAPLQSAQDFSVSIRFADGSIGVLLYGTAGAKRRERNSSRRIASTAPGVSTTSRACASGATAAGGQRARGQDKGHADEMRSFAAVLRGEAAPPPVAEYVTSTALMFAAQQSLHDGERFRSRNGSRDRRRTRRDG